MSSALVTTTALLLLINIHFVYVYFINASQYLKQINNKFPAILKMYLVACRIRLSSHNYSHSFFLKTQNVILSTENILSLSGGN